MTADNDKVRVKQIVEFFTGGKGSATPDFPLKKLIWASNTRFCFKII